MLLIKNEASITSTLLCWKRPHFVLLGPPPPHDLGKIPMSPNPSWPMSDWFVGGHVIQHLLT